MPNSSDTSKDSQQPAHWYVLGVGAMGCLWACYLQQAGFPVTLVLRNAARKKLFDKAGCVTLIEANSTRSHTFNSCLIEELPRASIQYLLLATKSTAALAALTSLRPALQHRPTILLLQNGMGSQQQLAAAFPEARVYCAVSTEGANCPAAFTVNHAGRGSTAVGALNEAARSTSTSLLAALPYDQLNIQLVDNIEQKLWEKLAINCAINGLTAIYRCANGELQRIAEVPGRIARLCEEVETIAKAAGIPLKDSYTRAWEVIANTAENRSSMLQDIEHQRRSEMPYINGYICQLAERYQIPCPENCAVRDAVLAIESQYTA